LREQKHAGRGRRGMLIRIHVIPNAKEARVVKVGDDSLEVRLDERAVNGRANKRLLEDSIQTSPCSRIQNFHYERNGARTPARILSIEQSTSK